jgi:hypothetical protein
LYFVAFGKYAQLTENPKQKIKEIAMSAAPLPPPKVCPQDKARLRRYLALARKKYGANAAMQLQPGQRTCPRCHGAIPTQKLQILRSRPALCLLCGIVIYDTDAPVPESGA